MPIFKFQQSGGSNWGPCGRKAEILPTSQTTPGHFRLLDNSAIVSFVIKLCIFQTANIIQTNLILAFFERENWHQCDSTYNEYNKAHERKFKVTLLLGYFALFTVCVLFLLIQTKH